MMQWISANAAALLAIWALVGLLCDTVANLLSPGRARKILEAIAHISPGAVVSAVRAGRAALTGVGLMVLALALWACSASRLATIQADDATAMKLTGAACDLAAAQPAGQPWTDFVCSAVEAGEALIASIPTPPATDAGSAAPPATLVAGTVLVHVPAEQVTAFLERHPRRPPRAPPATITTVTMTAVDAGANLSASMQTASAVLQAVIGDAGGGG